MNLEHRKLLEEVDVELTRALRLHGPMHSAHEAYSVLLEEVDEFWEEVRKKTAKRSRERMREELIQIAAMAVRAIKDICE